MKATTIFILTFLVVLSVSCSSDDATTIIVPTSDIISTVTLYDDDQNIIDNSEMIVTVDGNSPLITATIDINGNYSLKAVPFGTLH